MDPEVMKTYIPLIADLVSALASIITACIAVYGVRIWKQELVGRETYEAVKSLVHQSHVAFRASSRLRFPTWDHERTTFTQEVIEHTTQNERWALSEAAIYRKRIEDYSSTLDRFSESLLQARVLIGSKVYESYLPFQKILREPVELISQYICRIEDRTTIATPELDEIKSLQKAFYISNSLDDELTQRIADARENGEKFLLPYLHRKSIRG
jgi:hypothetical protein